MEWCACWRKRVRGREKREEEQRKVTDRMKECWGLRIREDREVNACVGGSEGDKKAAELELADLKGDERREDATKRKRYSE